MATSGESATPPSIDIDTLARVLAFLRGNLAKTADELRAIEPGWVVSTPSLSLVWAVNHVRVALPLTFEGLVELADEQLAGARYLQIGIENQDAGPRLEAEFAAAGWKTEREVYMVLAASPDREADTSVVVDAGE